MTPIVALVGAYPSTRKRLPGYPAERYRAGDGAGNGADQKNEKRAKENEPDPLADKRSQGAGKYQGGQRYFEANIGYAYDQASGQAEE